MVVPPTHENNILSFFGQINNNKHAPSGYTFKIKAAKILC